MGRPWLLLVGLMLAACGPSGQTQSTRPTPTPSRLPSADTLLSYAAKGTDLGPGWTEQADPAGSNLTPDNAGHPCHQPFKTDALRLEQVNEFISNAGQPAQASNDIVLYRKNGAAQALAEFRSIATSCSSYTQVNSEGLTLAIDVHLSDIRQVNGEDAVTIERRVTLQGKSLYSVLLAVRVGDYVTEMFTISGDAHLAGRLAGLGAAASVERLKAAKPT